MSIQKTELYLSDYSIEFRKDYAIYDLSICNSEINPLHLNIPRGKKSNNNESPIKTQTVITQEVKKSLVNQAADVANQLFGNEKKPVSQIKETKSVSDTVKPVSEPSKSVNEPVKIASEVQNRSPVPSPTKEPESSSKPPPPMFDSSITEQNFTMAGEYLIPIVQPNTFKSQIIHEPAKGSNFSKIHLLPPNGTLDASLLRVDFNPKARTMPLKMYYKGENVGEIVYNPSTDSASCFVRVNDKTIELVALQFNPTNNSVTRPQSFEFIIPALKKVNNKSQTIQIPASDNSKLIEYSSRNAKESIRLRTRTPFMKNDDFDMTFDGKLSSSSFQNIIIYHEASEKRDICSFYNISGNQYGVTVCYPCSIIQGFIASVCSLVYAQR